MSHLRTRPRRESSVTYIFHTSVHTLWGSCWCAPKGCRRSGAGCLEEWLVQWPWGGEAGETWEWQWGDKRSAIFCQQLPGTTSAANLFFLCDTNLNKCAYKSSTPCEPAGACFADLNRVRTLLYTLNLPKTFTLEPVNEASPLWRRPGSICSGWEGQAGSISCQDWCSLRWAEWLCLHPSYRPWRAAGPRCCWSSTFGTSPPDVWRRRWCGWATWQRGGTPGRWRRFLWVRELMAWLTPADQMQH